MVENNRTQPTEEQVEAAKQKYLKWREDPIDWENAFGGACNSVMATMKSLFDSLEDEKFKSMISLTSGGFKQLFDDLHYKASKIVIYKPNGRKA